MIPLLLNHLWQSSVCVGGVGLIALALRRNSANTRFWLWFAASIKFLVPFAALTALGAYALTPVVPLVTAPTVTFIEPLAKPFSAPAIDLVTTRLAAEPSARPAPPAHPVPLAHPAPPARSAQPASPTHDLGLGAALLAIWAMGFLMLAARWLVRWSHVRALLREAAEVPIDAPVAVKFSASRLEPGLVGIMHPVILLPQGIQQQLSPMELQTVLAHELCHWRRHDNLLAAIHMVMEALFWFFPLIWWVGARLNAERESACDESVLADGNDPQVYAESILKVCRAYLQSPLACVAGVSGALKNRIETITENLLILRLNAARKFVLGASATAALVLPLALGLLAAPVASMRAKAAPILLPTKTAQSSTEQIPPLTPEPSTATLPTNQVAESTTTRNVPQTNEAATTSANAAPPPPSRLLSVGNLAVQSPDLSQLLPVTPELVASNNVPTAPAQHASNVSPAAAMGPNVPDQESAQLLATADAFCANNQVIPSDPRYLACLDIYLGAHSVDLVAKPLADGSLRAEPTPIFPHSTFHRITGLNALCGRFVLANPPPGEFQKCLNHAFALECSGGGAMPESHELSMLGACDWAAGRAQGAKRQLSVPVSTMALNDQPAGSNAPEVAAAKPDCAPLTLPNGSPVKQVLGCDTMTFTGDAIDQLRERQAVEARAVCTANNQGPSDSNYGQCVNRYLQSHYGWQVVERPDGSLGVGFRHWPGTPSYY